jgi:hypothetical protein
MATYTGAFYTADDNGNLVGNGKITIGSVAAHTGRSQRSGRIVLSTANNVTATIEVTQLATTILVIDGFLRDLETEVILPTLPKTEWLYWIKGHANVTALDASETNSGGETDCTDLNNGESRVAYTMGIMLNQGEREEGVLPNENISIGEDECYNFYIPVMVNANSYTTARDIVVNVTDGTTTDTYTIEQEANIEAN